MKKILTAAILAMTGLPALSQESSGESDPRKGEVLNRLNTMRVSVDFNGSTLEEAIGFLRDFTGLNILVDAEVYKSQSEEQLKVTLKVKDLLLKSVLKLVLSARELSAMYKEGVVLIVPKGKIDKAVTLQLYDVRDLLLKIQDFPGPKVELASPQKGGIPLVSGTFILEEPHTVLTEEFITDMVKQNTGDKSWEENPNASMSLTNGVLVVSQSSRVHQEIKQFINLLRQFK
jgi:type II secretory pathway component GspD/PulD (secretin)